MIWIKVLNRAAAIIRPPFPVPLMSRRWSVALLLVVGTGAAALRHAFRINQRRRRDERADLLDRLRGVPPEAPLCKSLAQEMDSLPAPVRRYLDLALGADARPIRRVTLKQRGRLKAAASSHRWMRFEARDVIVPPAHGFVWSAKVRLVPWVHLAVTDSLIDGQGSGLVSLQSAFPLTRAGPSPEMDSGSLHRFLAEAVWYPTALLPSASLQWAPLAPDRSLATLTIGEIRVQLEFRFGSTGEVSGIHATGRWGRFRGGYALVPWEGRFGDYERHDGVLIPTQGSVGWIVDGRVMTVWTGRVTSVEYER